MELRYSKLASMVRGFTELIKNGELYPLSITTFGFIKLAGLHPKSIDKILIDTQDNKHDDTFHVIVDNVITEFTGCYINLELESFQSLLNIDSELKIHYQPERDLIINDKIKELEELYEFHFLDTCLFGDSDYSYKDLLEKSGLNYIYVENLANIDNTFVIVEYANIFALSEEIKRKKFLK